MTSRDAGPPLRDSALVEGVRRGERGALHAFLEAMAPCLYRLAYGITRSEAEAEAILQRVLLILADGPERFPGRVELWVYRVTIAAALESCPSNAREIRRLENALPVYTDDGRRRGDRAFLRRDWSAVPVERLLSGCCGAAITAALEGLPGRERAVLLLRDVEGLSHEDVAAIVGESPDAVKSRLHRARMALREQITRVMPR